MQEPGAVQTHLVQPSGIVGIRLSNDLWCAGQLKPRARVQ
jgi:hypothetical protein